MKLYDAIIIGFGKGGKLLAAELSKRNWKVAVIERSPYIYGGTCINTGCIPTKSLIYEAKQAEQLYYAEYDKQAKQYTLAIGRKNKLISFLRNKDAELLKANPNITIYYGTASFVSEDSIKVFSADKKEILLKGKEIFINTGSTPIIPDVEGINERQHVFTSETLQQQSKLPKRLLILGAGTVGMEFATMYAGFGSKVILLEADSHFMSNSDRDIAQCVLESLKRKQIETRLNVCALSVYNTANGITLTYTDHSDGTPYFLEGDALLLATGRRPMIDDLNLHAAGVQTNTRGAIIVDEHLHTTSPHIWALGDVRGGDFYANLSTDDFRIITNQLFGNKKRYISDRLPVPHVVFTNPPLAHIGVTEKEAIKHGYSFRISRLPTTAVLRARTLQDIDGMMKAIVDIHTGRIIGCTLFCVDAPEVINLVSLAMKTGQDYTVLRDFIFTQPSMSEGLNDLFEAF